MDAVIDASSLIIAARVNGLELLVQVYGPVGVSPAVFQEVVVNGERLGRPDPWAVRAALEKGWLVSVELSPFEAQAVKRLRQSHRALGLGECEALALADHRRCLILVEDRKARAVARARGLTYSLLQLVPLYAYLAGKIGAGRCLEMLDRIAGEMGTDLAVLHALKAAVNALDRPPTGGEKR